MMQSSDSRNRDDLTHFSRFDQPLFRSVLFKPKMGSIRVVIINIRPDDPLELAVIDRDHMIQAVPS